MPIEAGSIDSSKEEIDVAIIGAGAAGLMAAIQAGRRFKAAASTPRRKFRVVALDRAKTLGAKILVAGGGRCNVTHYSVDASDYNGSSSHAIRKVLSRFHVSDTVQFFSEMGVTLKREQTGKLFPTTDRARTILEALTQASSQAGVELRHPFKVESVQPRETGFSIQSSTHTLLAKRVVLATGGRSLPKSGSDGHGYSIASSLGHSISQPILPALVPLLLESGHPLTTLAGVSAPARLQVRRPTGAKVIEVTGDVLCTHLGLSGPAVLDISRHLSLARHEDPAVHLLIAWVSELQEDEFDQLLLELKTKTPLSWLRDKIPERLARLLLALADVPSDHSAAQLTRVQRRALVKHATGWPLQIVGDRGFPHAEVTAGGIPLREIRLDTMESRICPGLHVCGEICDVDGRIGGFNFQWAWASGFLAGVGSSDAIISQELATENESD